MAPDSEVEEPMSPLGGASPVNDRQRRVFAVLPRVSAPSSLVSEVGQQVFDTFAPVWNEVTMPVWGDRAIYWAYVPMDCMDNGAGKYVGADHPYILTERRAGWSLLTPDDLTVLMVELSLAGSTFSETAMRDTASWFTQMADRLTEHLVRDKDETPTIAVNSLTRENGQIEPTRALQYAIAVLPRAVGQVIEGIVRSFQTTSYAQRDEIKALKSQNELLERELRLRREEEEARKVERITSPPLSLLERLVAAQKEKEKNLQDVEKFRRQIMKDPSQYTEAMRELIEREGSPPPDSGAFYGPGEAPWMKPE